MKYTNKLGLPIWDNPETDVFDIGEFNKGNQVVDDIVTNLTERITNLENSGGGTGDSSGGGTGLTEEQANNIEKIPSIESTVISNSQAIANKADKEEVEAISSQLDTKANKSDIETINEQLDNLEKHFTGGSGMQEHSHANKATLDKLGETDGKLTFGGNKIDFEIPDGGIGLTKEQAQQLQTAYAHSQTTHVQFCDIPTKTSQLTNDSNYATKGYVETKINEASLGGASLPECFITVTGGV